MINDWSKVTEETPIRVVFYARVSTETAEQLSAFENQIKWYEDLLAKHPNWELVADIDTYIDKGISATQVENRSGFMQMIEDASQDKFDMIVTREVSRFSRNALHELQYTSKLKEYHVQVYYANDNIKTIQDTDNEFRHIFKAFDAQEESRKISERAKAGQRIARKKGVLYGSGNILGYRRIRKASDTDKINAIGDKSKPTFAIVQEQAETVRIIFDLYKRGYGLKKIKNELIKLGRKNSEGKVKWFESSISRMLENPMYIGKQHQCKTEVVDYLKHTVKKNPKDQYVLIEGDFEPIISEELFYEVQEIKKSKRTSNYFNGTVYGKRVSQDKWLSKLECNCGGRFQQYKWRKNKLTGEVIKGYACRHRIKNGTADFREQNGISIVGACDMRSIPGWKFEFMGIKIFTEVWGDKKDAVLSAFDYIADNYVANNKYDFQNMTRKKAQVEQYKSKLKNLLELFTDGDIPKEEYKQTRAEYLEKIDQLNTDLELLESKQENLNILEDIDAISNVLSQFVDFTKEELSKDMAKNFVDKIVVRSENSFEWYINLNGDAEKYMLKHSDQKTNTPYEIRAEKTKNMRDTKYTQMFTLYLNYEEALAFKKRFGKYLRINQWEDILVQVYLRVA